jgi:hypothetical protein
LVLDDDRLADENPTYVVFNGADGALRDDGALLCKVWNSLFLFFIFFSSFLFFFFFFVSFELLFIVRLAKGCAFFSVT